ncbi:MAG: hypothetical protein COA78_15280 [Blastopirellula sp.]|nr:MAG: hypothetical protein COA78_15280 [Blastopirellula sp.]
MSFLKNSFFNYAAAFSLSLFALSLTGCGGAPTYDTGLVTGTITLDGSPLEGARVEFYPEGGSSSNGMTDASGKYELKYTKSTMGAVPGSHSVSITTYDSGDPDSEPPIAAVPEKVPTKYNTESKLNADVVLGPNEHNFDLETAGGEVVQPQE